MNGMPSFADPSNLEREQAQIIEAPANALALLQAVYRNEQIPLGVRIRAAIEAIPFESPKLSATAIIPGDGDFAERLKRAIIRSRQGPKLIEQAGANRSRLPV
jgi:hypothetical protein